MATLGETLVKYLEAYGIDTVFGIPGVHTVEMYRGLATSSIHHVTPRHEQGAGFMADGYYRATGRIAAAFVITGPGVTNILTPMAQAYADSIPMLVVSSVNRTEVQGMGGDLHEIRNQGLIAAQAAAFSHTITHPDQLLSTLARAFAVFESARPRPVHIQVPLDLFEVEVPEPTIDICSRPRSYAAAQHISAMWGVIDTLEKAKSPVILCGGGAQHAQRLQELAEHLDAPVVMTTNARGVMPSEHALSVPASPSLKAVRALLAEADCVLALGTEMGRTDFDMYDEGGFDIPGHLIRVDVDPEAVVRGAPSTALVAELRSFAPTYFEQLERLSYDPRPKGDGARRAEQARSAAWKEIGPKYQTIVRFLETIRETLPAAPIVCDSTQAAYAGNLFFAAQKRRSWFNAATGYGALGYGLPAAVGTARALYSSNLQNPDAPDEPVPVVCICGDGGLQFSLAELGCAIEEELPVILLVWNNQGYGEIKDYMVSRQIAPVGVDLHTPDFVGLGRAYGCEALALERVEDLPGLLREAATRKGPTLIEIDEALVLST